MSYRICTRSTIFQNFSNFPLWWQIFGTISKEAQGHKYMFIEFIVIGTFDLKDVLNFRSFFEINRLHFISIEKKIMVKYHDPSNYQCTSLPILWKWRQEARQISTQWYHHSLDMTGRWGHIIMMNKLHEHFFQMS